MITRRMLLLMSLLFIVTVFIVPTYGNDGIDYGICDPLNFTIKPPPPPALSESYQTKIEWKWINTGTTVDVIDTYNGITSSGSVDMFIEGQETKMLFDYKENQVVTYTKNDKGCTVRGLGTLELYQGKMWLTSLHSLYSVFKSADVAYMGETVVRATNTSWFQTCLYLYQFNITAQMNIYFSAYGWGMAFSRPDETIPVRIEIIASQSLKPFHVVGDLTEFNPSPIVDETIMQVPPGTFCDGRLSRRPLNLFPESFSLVFERVDLDFSKITYEKIWFDSKKKLIRRDYKEASGNDPDPSSEIFDFNLGIQYTIDSYMGTCDPVRALDPGDLFVVSNKNGTLRMMTSPEYFHAQNTDVQYIGSRETRGVDCDVWVGKYLDDEANMNFTIEWYFTKDHWVEAVGGIIQPASLYRMDIWQGRNARPIIRNVLQFNSEAPPQEVFDITPCFPWTGKARLLVHFAVLQGQISSVSNMYLKDLLHTTLVSKAFLPPLRISKVSVQLLGETDLYLDGILLDSAPIVNPRIVPPPPPRHSLTASLEFLNGAIEGKWQLFVNSTIGNTQVVLESRGLIKIDYRSEFTTTPVTTMSTTTEATPKLITPSTAKSTKYETPPSLPTVTNKPCECPPPPTCPTTKVVIPTSSCPKVQCPSPPIQQGCTTQKTSCPPCTAVSCPACSTPAPCPTVIQTTPKPCPPLKFRSCPPVVPTAKTCPPVQQTPCPTGAAVPGVAGANKQSSKSGGVSSGTVAGVAMIMLVVGCIFGVILLIAYKKIRGSVAPDRRNILDKYLDDDNKY